MTGSSSGWGSRSPRTADRMEDMFSRYGPRVTLEKTEVMLERARNKPGWEKA